ncbi:MAG: RHS repeat-associated core domain-containing protein, partial [Paludibacteraceae bacterium]|nr:RHS repeat-associated core domain-containing protein [Paludibacteraceae bacterium]
VATYTYKVNSTDTVAAQTENTYDSFKRITNKKVSLVSATKQINKQVGYNRTRVTDVQDVFDGANLGKTEYIYDTRGRITKNTYVSDTTASQENTYEYDEFGQLIRENNKALDKTYVYEYNDIGNITLVKEYDYHAPNEALPRCQKCVKYEYDSECPDKLTKFDGNEIEYDSIGCPTKYKGENYEWKNDKLSKIHRSTFYSGDEHYATRTFTYDGYGRRTQVQFVSGVNFAGANAVYNYSKSSTHNYNYDNSGRLIRESYTATDFSGTVHETRELVYLYDESGIIGAMYSYNGSALQPYYYHRNLQGDVIAIYDANGEKHAEYAYDAWGNCEVVYADNDKVAYANPIRYRGYYYDTETGLYYLNARYYSPEWRRFISPDAAEYIDPETPNGLNLYAYCVNDPVNYADPSGHDPEWWQWALFGVGAALVAVAAGMALLGTGGVAAFGMGALIGSAAVGGAGAVVGGVVGYATGGVEGILGGVLTGFGIGAIVGFAVGGSIGVGIWNHDVKLARQFLTNNNVHAGFHDDIINSFKYRIKIKSINVDTTVYRYYSDSARRISYWVTPRTYSNPVQKLALAYGNNTAKYLAQLTLTSGARVLTGTVAGAGGLLGGGIQYYVYDLAWILG